jgi:signal transduction histidine kinase
VTFSQKKLVKITRRIKWRIYTFAFFAFLAGGILACYLSWIILKPVKRLVQASKAIAAGDWEMRVEESGDDEIGELTRDFNRMAASLANKRRELEESYKELSRQERMAEIGKFSTIVAHELKNPLGIIRGSINILGKKTASKETRETMVAYINEEVTRLNQLAEEFLVFARPPLPRKEEVDLGVIANKVKALAEAQGDREKGVSIKVEAAGAHPTIFADKNQLFQALLNLLENGVQSSPQGGVVTIAFRTGDDGATIEVSDNGPGVKAEDKEKVFEPFFTRKEKGTGLGLAITKRIVEVHDGRIGLCESSSGGACFTIWLPKGKGSANK